MRRLLLFSIVLTCFYLVPRQVHGQRSWNFDYFMGAAYCFKMPLLIEQEGYEKIKFTAHYRTESFKLPFYYSCKIGTIKDRKGWELELVHLKIFLTDNPPEVQYFSISHGFNYLTINRVWETDPVILRFGAGLIISHPESEVRNMIYDINQGLFNRGYYVSGPGLQIGAEKRIPIFKGLSFSLEVKAAASVTKVGIAGGHAIVPQAGLHCLLGVGYTFN